MLLLIALQERRRVAINGSFLLLPVLPVELRLMIWEHIWPAAQVIEAASHEILEDEYKEFSILCPTGSLTTILQTNFGSRNLEGRL
jgi:hypothetical protein